MFDPLYYFSFGFFFFNKKKFNFELHYLIENIKNFLLLTNKLIQKPLIPLIILY